MSFWCELKDIGYGPSLADQGLGPDDGPEWPKQPRCYFCGCFLPRLPNRAERGPKYPPERILGLDDEGQTICIGWDICEEIVMHHYWDCKRCKSSHTADEVYP